MRFDIVFHTPFRIGAGHASDGSDVTVDRATLLPASSIKGLMRSAARDLLRLPADSVGKVFGTAWDPSPWSWSDAQLEDADGQGPQIRARARIRIEPESFTVAPGALLIADEVLAASARFTVDRVGWIDPGQSGMHETVLLAAARAVTAVGGDRRRGLGWVTIIPADPQWSRAHLLAAIALTRPSPTAGSGATEPGSGGQSDGKGQDHG